MSNISIESGLHFKTSKIEIPSDFAKEKIKANLISKGLAEDYINSGNLQIESANEISYFTAEQQNFFEKRDFDWHAQPNRNYVPAKTINQAAYNLWDFQLSPDEDFHWCEKSQEIEDSHHAAGCQDCHTRGKVKCYSCNGRGDDKCSTCDGRAEVRCSSCSGTGEHTCFWCSGSGRVKDSNGGYRNCRSCSGRGRNPCSSCRNGYNTCSTCSGRGRVSCYSCSGSGEVTCYSCEGFGTIDQYLTVSASYNTDYRSVLFSKPLPGFNSNLARKNNFNTFENVFQATENRFKQGYFDVLRTHPEFNKIVDFFNYSDAADTRLLKSQLSYLKDTYHEITFSFYDENYRIFFDRDFKKSYYLGSSPIDSYELGLISFILDSAKNNKLDQTTESLKKLSETGYINIRTEELVKDIVETKKIYRADKEFKEKHYSEAERTLNRVEEKRKTSNDFRNLKSKLSKVFSINGGVSLVLSAVVFFLLGKIMHLDFRADILMLVTFIMLAAFGLSFLIRNIHYSRYVFPAIFGVLLFALPKTSIFQRSGNQMVNQQKSGNQTEFADIIVHEGSALEENTGEYESRFLNEQAEKLMPLVKNQIEININKDDLKVVIQKHMNNHYENSEIMKKIGSKEKFYENILNRTVPIDNTIGKVIGGKNGAFFPNYFNLVSVYNSSFLNSRSTLVFHDNTGNRFQLMDIEKKAKKLFDTLNLKKNHDHISFSSFSEENGKEFIVLVVSIQEGEFHDSIFVGLTGKTDEHGFYDLEGILSESTRGSIHWEPITISSLKKEIDEKRKSLQMNEEMNQMPIKSGIEKRDLSTSNADDQNLKKTVEKELRNYRKVVVKVKNGEIKLEGNVTGKEIREIKMKMENLRVGPYELYLTVK